MGGVNVLIPVSDAAKTKAMDFGAFWLTGLAIFKAIPWPEIAGFLACVYWVVRIVGERRKKRETETS